ncbi:MAG: hypothetical protein HC773_26780 [Scytonema sp. CRU_2_7]|nr:hypothetical protein [Scytonema sp. CRU_2_7]
MLLNEEKWQKVKQCPLCGSSDTLYSGKLHGTGYNFRDEIIPFIDGEVAIIKCNVCGIYYKNVIPSPSFLSEVFSRHSGKIWTEPYGFAHESKLLKELNKKSIL